METEREKQLWKIAKKRVSFKKHFASYIIINIMFWCTWFFTDRENDDTGFPWPVFPMLGWGMGILFNFISAYVLTKEGAVEKEFERLRSRNN